MLRATKIVATLGPASSDPEVLERLLRAGVDVVRLNFSHGKAQDHIDRARLVREVAAKIGKPVALMADLQGPKIRVGKFADGKVLLEPGAAFVLDAERTEPGDLQGVGLDYKELPRDVRPGDTLLLNDGLIKLTVEAVRGEQVHTRVVLGGELSNNKGINKSGGGLTAPALTAKDMEDIKTAVSFQCEYLAVSFPKSATDMEMARQLANVAGEATRHKPAMIAKIERSEAIPQLEAILRASDGIMVARAEDVSLETDFTNKKFGRIDQSIAMGALFTAHHLGCKAIIALTESGSTALWMSRHNIKVPIYGMTSQVNSERRMTLYRNVRPLLMPKMTERDEALAKAEAMLVEKGVLKPGDTYAITCGEPMGYPGGTNMLKVCQVG